MHVAGSGGKSNFEAISVSLFREDIEEAIKKHIAADPDKKYVITEEPEGLHPQIFEGPCHGAFVPLTLVDKPVGKGTDTAITHSKIAEYLPWEEKTAPAVLKPIEINGEKVDPYLMALDKYNKPNPILEDALIEASWQHLLETLCKASPGEHDKSVFSIVKAICGEPGEPYWGGVGRGTSVGYVDNWFEWSDLIGGKNPGKTLFFGKGQEYDLNNKYFLALKKRIEDLIERMKRGERSLHIWKDFLKDERLKLWKVQAGKSRFISPAPLDLTVLTRMYFGAFCVFMQKGKVQNGSAIGANPYSTDWQAIWNEIKRVVNPDDPKLVAGDFGEYDTRFLIDVMRAICKMINAWYDDGPENAKIREMIFLEIMNSRHIHGNQVFEWFSSEPSGNPLTAFINTLYTLILCRMVYVRAFSTNESNLNLLRGFSKHVYVISLGDDHVFGLSDAAAQRMRPDRIAEVLQDFGQRYLNADKTDPGPEFHRKDQITFLKRGFRFEPLLDRHVAPLDLPTILEAIRWTKKGEDSDEVSKQTFDSMLRELALHGEDVWNSYAPIMLRAYDKAFHAYHSIRRWEVALADVSSGEWTSPELQF
jgi:hypothetical protein